MTQIVVGLGSNFGDSKSYICEAIVDLKNFVELIKSSYLYESEPMYVTNQSRFLNAAILARTELSPRQVLAKLKGLEGQLGRQQRDRYGPREIDLDLLIYGSTLYAFEDRSGRERELVVPHPRLHERRFVLDPLVDLDPSIAIPGQGLVSDLLRQPHVQSQEIRRVSNAPIPI